MEEEITLRFLSGATIALKVPHSCFAPKNDNRKSRNDKNGDAEDGATILDVTVRAAMHFKTVYPLVILTTEDGEVLADMAARAPPSCVAILIQPSATPFSYTELRTILRHHAAHGDALLHFAPPNLTTAHRGILVQQILVGECVTPAKSRRSRGGNGNVVRTCLEHGASAQLCSQDYTGVTALIAACSNGYCAVVQTIVNDMHRRHASAAELETADYDGRTALMAACELNWVDVAEILCEAQCDVNAHDNMGQTALMKTVLGRGLCVGQASHDGGSGVALHTGDDGSSLVPLLSTLCRYSATASTRDGDGATPLILAAKCCSVEVIEFLLQKTEYAHDYVNARQLGGHTALVNACRRGVVPGEDRRTGERGVVRCLVDAGGVTAVNVATREGWTPLIFSCHGGNVGHVKVLLEARADVDQHDLCGRCPLVFAVNGGHTEISQLLIQARADVNFNGITEGTGTTRWTPLMHACMEGHVELCSLLLKAGANVNAFSLDPSPLAFAVAGGNEAVVDLLLAHIRADVHESHTGVDNISAALCIAQSSGNAQMVEKLERAQPGTPQMPCGERDCGKTGTRTAMDTANAPPQ